MDKFVGDILEKTREISQRYIALERLISSPEIIAHNSYLQSLIKEQNQISDIYHARGQIIDTINEQKLCEKNFADAEEDYKQLLAKEIKNLEQKKLSLAKQILLQLTTPNNSDFGGAVLTIKQKSVDSGGFFEQVVSMYSSYFNLRNLSAKLVSNTPNEQTFVINHNTAYELLKYESGTHKGVWSGQKSKKIIVMVLPSIEQEKIEILDNQLKIDLFHASGAGGQNVNKVETAVRITHLPTKIVVVCQDERSQLKNKEKAIKILQEKLIEISKKRWEAQQESYRVAVLSDIKNNKIVREYDFVNNIIKDSRTDYKKDLIQALNGDLEDIIGNIALSYQVNSGQ